MNSRKPLPACRYGASCYQKNPAHQKAYSHVAPLPASSSGSDTEASAYEQVDDDIESEDDTEQGADDDKDEGEDGEEEGVVHEEAAEEEEEEKVPAVKPASRRKLPFGIPTTAAAAAAPSPKRALPSGKEVFVKSSAVTCLDLGDASSEEEDILSGRAISPKPKLIMQLGDTQQVSSKTSAATYTVKRTGPSEYYCTCPAWRNQGAVAVCARSCKHLKELLGEEFEKHRSLANGGPSVQTSAKRKATDALSGTSVTKTKKQKAVAPAVLLAQSWNLVTGQDPTGWWLSEKLDGVRSIWLPDEKKFYSRLGNPFTAPDWFIKDLPTDMSLDGELFCGRALFSQTVSVVKTHNSTEWHRIKFHIFDAPSLTDKTFEHRQAAIAERFKKHPSPNVVMVKQEICRGRKHLMDMLEEVETDGGEGVMMRQPLSLYEGKRSKTLLKVKNFYDAEAKVLGHEVGKGKNSAVCGALQCVMESGKNFRVGTGLTDADRRKPPPVGAIITYRFQELTNDGVPRFPSFVGIRIDADKPKDYVKSK
ncbi:hypothetical protein HKX48_003663 [Thoreauomyces humboldtii]|nr:hypothetical protein HKX48_003663 [Thoreauomyces humboldtii]